MLSGNTTQAYLLNDPKLPLIIETKDMYLMLVVTALYHCILLHKFVLKVIIIRTNIVYTDYMCCYKNSILRIILFFIYNSLLKTY